MAADTVSDRDDWIRRLDRMARPVLSRLADGRLKAEMPVQHSSATPMHDRRAVSHLEAFGRTLSGLAPWLQSESREPARVQLLHLTTASLDRATDPASPDYLNFCGEHQALVDAAFLAQSLLRAPRLWQSIEPRVRQNIVTALRSTRALKPPENNWLLFSATIEAFFASVGEPWELGPVDHALRQHERWYKGDGAYGDGPSFHWDYYNSFVIHPMLLDVLAAVTPQRNDWDDLIEPMHARARRMAGVLERLVAPDGSFPVIGRSIAYRSGAFHLLAHAALHGLLPADLPAAQARAALTAVIRRTLDAPGTFDEAGWLRIGLCGDQPDLGEPYISTGSLYLATTAFLPLGLLPDAPFWDDAAVPTTSQKAWSGQTLQADHAI